VGHVARRTALVAVLIVLGAAGQAGALALAGAVLVDRSDAAVRVLAAALVASVLSDVSSAWSPPGLTADWAASVRRGLCRVAFGQQLPALENTPVGELLDRIDSDVYQVGSELRGSGVRLAQSLAVAVLSIVTAFFAWWPAGIGMLAVSVLLVAVLTKPIQRISPLRVARRRPGPTWPR
jgi:ABC-type multidrug transport system fused ATPase/permease subunit